MSEFTKGKWKAYLSDEHGWCVAIEGKLGGKGAIANVSAWWYITGGLPGEDHGKANAHLIAAAPELYEACKTILEFGLSDGSKKMIKEAIANAEGRPTR